jgi:cephalosporin-C deacetylase
MMNNVFKKFLIMACILSGFAGMQEANAQKAKAKPDAQVSAGDSVTTQLDPHSKDGLFHSRASYTFTVKNTFPNAEVGKLSYVVTTEADKKLKSDSVKIKLGAKSSSSYNFEIPPLPPGFYKINFMINVTDYDDTTRRSFGLQPEKLRSSHAKPADFETFWKNSKAELDKVKPEYKLTELPDTSKDHRRAFLVEMKSLDGLVVRGYLTEPRIKHRKFAVLLALPGYQVALGPMYGPDPDIAIFTINVRGSGNSRDVIDARKESWIVLNMEDKNKYVLRGAVMDCVRAVDFICSRDELRKDNIIAAGGSLGGWLALATSAVDKRISFCSAANPILCDIRNLPHEVTWPLVDFKKYVDTRPDLTMDKMYDNLDYFDGKNFASDLDCNTLMGLGMLDNLAPPDHVYIAYNEVKAPKHIIIFRDLGHAVDKNYNVYEGRWMRDTFALF